MPDTSDILTKPLHEIVADHERRIDRLETVASMQPEPQWPVESVTATSSDAPPKVEWDDKASVKMVFVDEIVRLSRKLNESDSANDLLRDEVDHLKQQLAEAQRAANAWKGQYEQAKDAAKPVTVTLSKIGQLIDKWLTEQQRNKVPLYYYHVGYYDVIVNWLKSIGVRVED